MWHISVCFFLLGTVQMIFGGQDLIGIVHNVSVMASNKSSTIINGTCNRCLCALMISGSFSSFNCFANNNTCQIFSQPLDQRSLTIMNNTPSSFYFFAQVTCGTRLTTHAMTTITTLHYEEYLWTFDWTYQDLSSTFNGTPVNGPQFNSSTITGYGSSLFFSSTAQQAVATSTPFLNLNNRSWTFELWIYPLTVSNSTDYGLIGQCHSPSTCMCFHLIIRQEKLYMGFYADDLFGVTSLVPSKWYHVAFVFDRDSRNQSIYLNGLLDSNRTANSFYEGNSGDLVFGRYTDLFFTYYFDGFFDRLSFINRAKTSAEILDDATLTLYFSFDNASVYDSGPLRINGSLVGSTSTVSGRVGDALQLGPSFPSYFRVSGLVLLGISNHSYSMSIWIKPAIINDSAIIHVSSKSNGLDWCVGMLSLSSAGQLIAMSYKGVKISLIGPILSANSWAHAAITYSSLNGLRLYVNGTLRNSTTPFSYVASNIANYLFLASPLNSTACAGIDGQFFGAVDEFRLYSRELTAYDVCTLFHP